MRAGSYLIGIGIVALAFAPFATLAAQGAPPEVRAVVAKMSSMSSFKATVRIGSGSSLASAELSYSNGRVHLRFSDGRVLASNGRYVVAYNPVSRTAGKQPMAAGGGGIGWLLSGFDYRVSGSQAHGRAVDPAAGVQEVRLAWGRDSILQRLSIKRRDSDSWFTIALSNVRVVGGFPAGLFSYSPPAGSRTVENPLNER